MLSPLPVSVQVNQRSEAAPQLYWWQRDLRLSLGVFAVGWMIHLLLAWPQRHPPYMDAYYYVDLARSLASGAGLHEQMVWNYMTGFPAPSHAGGGYWLPGLSVLLAPAWSLAGYQGIVLLMAALAAMPPLLVVRWARYLGWSYGEALAAAGLTLFNGLWFHDWNSPDAFVLNAVLVTAAVMLGGMALQPGGEKTSRALWLAGGAGSCAALSALTRQEGVIVLLALLLTPYTVSAARGQRGRLVVATLLGFLPLYLPWLLYTLWSGVGAGLKTALMQSYNSFYSINAAHLSLRGYLSWGWAHLVQQRIDAVLFMVQIWLVQWLIVLVPALLLGIWVWRLDQRLRPFLLYWLLLALALPLVVPAMLENGTLQHATGALVPGASLLIVTGLGATQRGMARLMRRPNRQLGRILSIGAVLLAATVSLEMAARTTGAGVAEYERTAAVLNWLAGQRHQEAPVMVVDPPAYTYLAKGVFVVTPSDGPEAVRTVASHYGVHYWALDPIHGAEYEPLYRGTVQLSWARRVAMIDGVQIYQLSV